MAVGARRASTRPVRAIFPGSGVASKLLIAYMAGLRRLGFDADAEMPALRGIQVGQMVDGGMFDEMLTRAAGRLHDPHIGLTLVSRLSIGMLGPIDYMFVMSNRVRDALETLVARFPKLTQRQSLTLIDEGSEARLVLSRQPHARPVRHLDELVFGLIVDRLRQSTGQSALLAKVSFTGAAPETLEIVERHFGCRVEYGAVRKALHVPRMVLDLPFRTADPTLAAAIAAAIHQDDVAQHDPLIERARARIREQLASPPSLAQLAAQLAVPVRTLQRHLGDHGCSYRTILDEERCDRALALLRDQTLTPEDIARAIGFLDPNAFYRAFHRWTGRTPGDIRTR